MDQAGSVDHPISPVSVLGLFPLFWK